MSKLWTGLAIAVATLAFTYTTAATLAAALTTALTTAATGRTHADYAAAAGHASARYQAARSECESFNGNEKDLCVVQAKAAEKRAKAVAEARYKGTIKSRTEARIAAADADFMVAQVLCHARSGKARAVCLSEAKAGQAKTIADARANKEAADTNPDPRATMRDPTRVPDIRLPVPLYTVAAVPTIK